MSVLSYLFVFFFFKQKTAYEIGLGIPADRSSDLKPSCRYFPKLRLILILNSFLGSSDSLVFSELFHSLAPRPLAARSISDFRSEERRVGKEWRSRWWRDRSHRKLQSSANEQRQSS